MMNQLLLQLVNTIALEAGWSKALSSSANANKLQKERATKTCCAAWGTIIEGETP
jgi:hypothetical protein